MTTRTRKAGTSAPSTTPAPAGTPAKRAAAKKTPAARTPRKRTPSKNTGPKPSLVKTRKVSLVKPLPVRARDFVTDAQIYATHAARLAGLPIHRIRDWADHGDGTAIRPLADGSHLHYTHATRTLRWKALCPMGAIHEYVLDSPSAAIEARVDNERCNQPHATFDHISGMSRDELAAQGVHTGPTWARPDLLGDDITETIPVPDEVLTRATASAADTQPIPTLTPDDLAARADDETPKEHPQP